MKNQRPPTLFSSLIESCTRFKFYAEIVGTSLGRAFAYLALLAVISAVSFTAYLHEAVLPSVLRASDTLPLISIKNGKLTVESEGDWYVYTNLYADARGTFKLDLDLSTTKTDRYAPTDHDYAVVLTRYTVIVKEKAGRVTQFDLPYLFKFGMERKYDVRVFIEAWQWPIMGVCFVATWAAHAALMLVAAFLLSILGLFLWWLLQRDLTYGKLLTLCIYALTPSTLLSVLLLWLNAEFVLPRLVLEYQLAIELIIALEFVVGGLLAIQSISTSKADDYKTLTERML